MPSDEPKRSQPVRKSGDPQKPGVPSALPVGNRPPSRPISVTAAPPSGTVAPKLGASAQQSQAIDPADAADLSAGRKIGKYTIIRTLGRGGMGVVYEAMDVPLQRKVALKILPQEFSSDDQALQRFIREARMAARLNHPNAVAVYEIGRKGTVYFIAMELVSGASAQELLVSGSKMAWKQATRAMIDACKGLSAAHAAGMIHRDIKPSNLLWTDSGTVKVSDFGLAKPHNSENLSVTRRDQFVGTPLFMSPEQCRNDAVDNRSDIYSLGATYFMLLTGRAPYDQGSAIQILFAHCSAPIPDVTETHPDVPPMAAHIIRKAMAKRPEDRYQRVDELLNDLEMVLGTSAAEQAALVASIEGDDLESLAAPLSPMEPAVGSGMTVNWPWIIGGTVVAFTVLIGIVIALVLSRPSSTVEVAQQTTPVPKAAPVASLFENVTPAQEPKVEAIAQAVPNSEVPIKPIAPPAGSSLPAGSGVPMLPPGAVAVMPENTPPTYLPTDASTTPVAQTDSPNVSPQRPEVAPGDGGPVPGGVAPTDAPKGPPADNTGPQPGGGPGGPLPGGSGPGQNDPVAREFIKASIYAESTMHSGDAIRKKQAAQIMVLWFDFYNGSQHPRQQVLAKAARERASKLAAGTFDEYPRVVPLIEGVPLPPKDPSPEIDRGPGSGAGDRPQPPRRPRRQ